VSRPPSPPPQLPGFEFVEPLGTGGFADVFLYEQLQPRRRVAVKVLLADRLATGAAQEFADEANVMAMLSTHPAIVTIYQTGVADDGRPYLVMEYCPRPNLQQRARKEPFSVAEALRVGVQVAGAVETAHRAGVLHRDIKPANILVTAYNRPALTDFGIASTTGAVNEAAGMSIPWSPPESFGDPPQSSARSDVYALAATLYSLLTGRSPFERTGQRNSGADLISRIEREPLPALGRADVPESLTRVLERGMAKNPADRFPSAVAFARALQKIQIELSHSVTAIDIVDDHPADLDPDEDDDGRTRVREVVSIDPSPSATRPSAATRPVQPATDPALPGPRFDPPSTAGSEVEATVVSPVRSEPVSGAPLTKPADGDATRVRPPQIVDPMPSSAPAAGNATVAPPAGYAPASPSVPSAPPAPGAWAAAPVSSAPTSHPPMPSEVSVGEPGSSARRPRRGLLWAALAVVAVLLLGGGSVLAVNLLNAAGPAPKPSVPATADPQDVTSDTVPPVTDIVATKQGDGSVRFDWTNPKKESGDTYLVSESLASGPGDTTVVDSPVAFTTFKSDQPTCITIELRRSDGRSSTPALGCLP
jgi:serine/threonine protein kinase